MKLKTLKDIEMIKRKLNILMNYLTYMFVGQAVFTHLRKYNQTNVIPVRKEQNGVNILLKQKNNWFQSFIYLLLLPETKCSLKGTEMKQKTTLVLLYSNREWYTGFCVAMIQSACLGFCLDYELLNNTDLTLFYLLRYLKNLTTFLTFLWNSIFKQDKWFLSIA